MGRALVSGRDGGVASAQRASTPPPGGEGAQVGRLSVGGDGDLPILSADEQFDGYPVERVW
ncbi:MAG: hypothetical protein EXR71_05455 [Myxococcales bacterium]|nr:hypothetical protein [Myxococcales bacterium]